MSARIRNNVVEHGAPHGRPVVFAHGFGCDQTMWRFVWPAFADDVLQILRELDLQDVVFVGHSVSAVIGMLAAADEPERFGRLVLLGPSPRYNDSGYYVGGFTREAVEDLLEAMRENYVAWAHTIVGNPDRPALSAELAESFCRVDHDIAAQFARATFLADNRADLLRVGTPALVLQCTDDVIAPDVVGRYVHRHLVNSTLVRLRATGHGPHLSAPDEPAHAIASYLG